MRKTPVILPATTGLSRNATNAECRRFSGRRRGRCLTLVGQPDSLEHERPFDPFAIRRSTRARSFRDSWGGCLARLRRAESNQAASQAAQPPDEQTNTVRPPGFGPDTRTIPEWTKQEYPPKYLEGIELFNNCDFFESHEAWEELWQEDFGPRANFSKD